MTHRAQGFSIELVEDMGYQLLKAIACTYRLITSRAGNAHAQTV
jgi:hypothetical protein